MRNKDDLIGPRKLNNIWECPLLVLTGIYILFLSVFNTTYNFPTIPQFHAVLYCLAAAVLFRIAGRKLWNRELLLSLLLGIVYFLTYRTGKEHFLLFLAVLTMGTTGMNYRTVLKVYIAVVGAFCLLWVVSSFGGLISNLVYFRSGHLRSSWGMAYPTDFASTLLFLLMMTWLAWDELPDALVILGAALLFLISWNVMESRTTMICSILLFCMASAHYIGERFEEKLPILKICYGFIRKLMIFAFPIFSAATALSVIAYAKGYGFAKTLNNMLSGRLDLTWIIFQEQGIHPFGKVFYQMGNGGNTLPPAALYFLDSSYPLILIRYGLALLIAVCVIWVGMSLRAYRRKDYRLLSVMALIAFHALAEHHFMEVNYNILLALPFAEIPECGLRDNVPKLSSLLKRKKKVTAVLFAELAAVYLAAPFWLSRMRTVLTVHTTIRGWKDRIILLGWVSVFLLAVIALMVLLCRIAEKRTVKKREIAVAAVCILIVAGYTVRDNRILREGAAEYEEVLNLESAAIDTMLSSASGKVCAEGIPELYVARFRGMSRSILYGDDLARMKCGTVITDVEEDRQRFIDKGFYFTELSNEHALYSNDPALIEALGEEGFVWTDYYSVEKSVDLSVLAEANELSETADGALILDPGENMEEGPWIDLFAGRYRVTFKLRIREESSEVDHRVCTLVVRDYNRARVLEKREIYLSEFDEHGRLSADVTYYTNGSRSTEFVIFPALNQGLEVSEIRYQKTGRN